MYDLMGMTPPPMPDRLKPKKVRRIIIDRTGEDDTARYTGLKMGQVLDDDEMGRALAEAQRKKKEGLELKKKLKEQEYVQPFAGKSNINSSKQFQNRVHFQYRQSTIQRISHLQFCSILSCA